MTTALRDAQAQRLNEGRARVLTSSRAGGAAPYGWEPVPSAALVEVPDEQAVIWLICHLYGLQWPYRKIAEHLNGMQIPGPSGRRWLHPAVRQVVIRSGSVRESATG